MQLNSKIGLWTTVLQTDLSAIPHEPMSLINSSVLAPQARDKFAILDLDDFFFPFFFSNRSFQHGASPAIGNDHARHSKVGVGRCDRAGSE